MFKRRQDEGFNLSFLDVMACGLGAVLMILILVKFQANSAIPSEEVERLEQELAEQSQSNATTQERLSQNQQNLNARDADNARLQNKIAQIQSELKQTQSAIEQEKAIIAELEQAIVAAAPQKADDAIEIASAGEEKYLIGMSVQGAEIGILLDTSASMTDEHIVDIIRRKIGNNANKQKGPKWQRAVGVAKWMLARVPKESKVSVVAFNKDAAVLGSQPVVRANDEAGLASLFREIDNLVPENGTDLQRALEVMTATLPTMTHLYVITDGLPTLMQKGSGFQESRGCKPVTGSDTTITGECRMRVFLHAFKTHAPKVPTNIVLLPLEGDSQAPAAYWDWADITGGTMISPAGNWP